MANFTGIANELAKKFIVAKNKRYALNHILHEMNYLVYSGSRDPLTYKAKSAIMKHLFEVIAGRRPLTLKEGEYIAPDFKDVVIFFERRNFILKQLKTGVKHREQHN